MGLMGAGVFILYNKVSAIDVQRQKEAEAATENGEDTALTGILYSLGTFIVNLADQGGKRYLRATIDVEYNNESLTEEIEKRLPQIKDSILMILPTKTFEDVNSVEGKNGLREEIITKLNSFFSAESITTIYFTEFVIQ
jgi:flagellar FliL protein